MYDVAFRMKIVQGQEDALQHKREYRHWQSYYRISVKESLDALKQWRVNETSMAARRPLEIKSIKQRPDGTASRMIRGASSYAFIRVEFVVQLPPQGLGVDIKLDGDMTARPNVVSVSLHVTRNGRGQCG